MRCLVCIDPLYKVVGEVFLCVCVDPLCEILGKVLGACESVLW